MIYIYISNIYMYIYRVCPKSNVNHLIKRPHVAYRLESKDRLFLETRFRLSCKPQCSAHWNKIFLSNLISNSKLGKSVVETFLMISTAFNDNCLSELQVYRWDKTFLEDHEWVSDGAVAVHQPPPPTKM